MTILEALTAVKGTNPSTFDDARMIGWLSELDGRIYRDVLCRYENAEDAPSLPYAPDTDINRALLAAFPHDDIYPKWLRAQIDLNNADYDRYQNDMSDFNASVQAFTDDFNRTHMPTTDYVKM